MGAEGEGEEEEEGRGGDGAPRRGGLRSRRRRPQRRRGGDTRSPWRGPWCVCVSWRDLSIYHASSNRLVDSGGQRRRASGGGGSRRLRWSEAVKGGRRSGVINWPKWPHFRPLLHFFLLPPPFLCSFSPFSGGEGKGLQEERRKRRMCGFERA